MSLINKDKFLEVAVEAALASSDLIMEALSQPKIIDRKGKTDLVTKTDRASEVLIKSIIRSFFPSHRILAEESGFNNIESEFLWVIDPLDGTTNFVHGYPSFAVSIGLLHKNIPLISVVLEMPNIKLYSAIQSEGVWCEGKSIKCSSTKRLINSLLTTGFGYVHEE